MKIKHQLTLILVCCCTFFAQAQTDNAAQRTAADNIEKIADDLSQTMTARLQLSPEQHQKLRKVNLRYAKAMAAARSKNSEGDWLAVEAEMEKLSAEHDQNLQEVLGKGKLEKWHQLLEGEATSRPRKFEDGH